MDKVDDATAKYIDFDAAENAIMFNWAVYILSNVTETGYAEMWESILDNTKYDDNDLLTYHRLKHCVLK